MERKNNLTLVHAILVQIFHQFEMFLFILFNFLLNVDSQLLLKFFAENAESTDSRFIIGNDGVLEKIAAGKSVEVITWFYIGIHVLQYSGRWKL